MIIQGFDLCTITNKGPPETRSCELRDSADWEISTKQEYLGTSNIEISNFYTNEKSKYFIGRKLFRNDRIEKTTKELRLENARVHGSKR